MMKEMQQPQQQAFERAHTTTDTDNDDILLLLNWSLLQDESIIAKCRTDLRHRGAMILKNFALPQGIEALKQEILSCPYNDSKQYYTPWQDQGNYAKYPDSQHPRNYMHHSSAAFVGRKSLEKTTDKLGMSIFEDDRLVNFLSKVSTKKIYRSSDENGSVYSVRLDDSHNPCWHFDESPYTAIIYLQGPTEGEEGGGGGAFEYVPWSRPTMSKDDVKGHEIVQKILMEKSRENVQRIIPDPGTLIFFSGGHSFHRAEPVSAKGVVRLNLVFTFGLEEGFANSLEVKNANEWDPADATSLKTHEHQ